MQNILLCIYKHTCLHLYVGDFFFNVLIFLVKHNLGMLNTVIISLKKCCVQSVCSLLPLQYFVFYS